MPGYFSFSGGSTAVTGGVVSSGVSVITVSDTVVGGLSVGGGAVLIPHPAILKSTTQQRRRVISFFIYHPPFLTLPSLQPLFAPRG